MVEINLSQLPNDKLFAYLGHSPPEEWLTPLWKFAQRLASVRYRAGEESLEELKERVEASSFVVVEEDDAKKLGF